MTPSPADLTYFVEVSGTLNLSRAAELLGISQPSLSLAMRRLEESVGTALLVRHKTGVSLTKAGKQLLAHTRQLLEQWDTIKSQTLASVHKVQGSFTIGCHPSLALYTFPRFLPELMTKYPKLEITLVHDCSRKITEQVINLHIDIGIVVNPAKHLDLIIKQLDSDEVTLWHNNSKSPIQDLQSGKAVLIGDPDLLQTQSILKKLKKDGIHYDRMITSSNLEVIAELTKSGCGVGILPANVAKRCKLTKIVDAPTHLDEICLLYRGENRDVKAIQTITKAIKSALNKH